MTARIVGFLTRADLGMRPPRSVSRNISPGRGGAAVHYGGPASRIDSHDDCLRIWLGWQRHHMDTKGWADLAYCVDEQTEILTDHGWVGYRDLREGDTVLTLNHVTGMSEWQPVLEVCVFPARMREMVSMESGTHSSLTTPDHRWPVERPHSRGSGPRREDGRQVYRPASGQDRRWVTSETFGYWDRVPTAADCADLPVEPKHSDALVEAVAWFWTEGHIHRLRDGRPARNVSITQSHVVNSTNCGRIRSALTRLFGPAVDGMPRVGGRTDGAPRWREYVNGRKVEFWLNADAGAFLQGYAPNRVPSFEFLRTLTRAQLALFIETSMVADNAGPRTLAQKDRAAAEAFQFACTLAGYATSLRERPPTASCATSMWQVRWKVRGAFMPYRLSRGLRVAYFGEVWCPRTPNQTWLARRNGTVYFTGNTGGFCDHGYALAGRGHGVRTAANGTNDGNQRFHAYVWLGGKDEVPTGLALDALDWWLDQGRRVGGNGTAVVPHRVLRQTECPGPTLIERARERNGQPIPMPDAPPPPPPAPDHLEFDVARMPILRRGGTAYFHNTVMQGCLRAHRFLTDVDGQFGPGSERDLKAFQARKGLPATGVCDGPTWERLLTWP